MEEQFDHIDEQSPEETPDVDGLTARVAELEAKIAEDARLARETELQGAFQKAGVPNFDRLRPFLIDEKLEGDTLDTLLEALAELNPKPKPVGVPSNGGASNEKRVFQAQLDNAAVIAKRSGRPEDVAAYTKLKQKLFGGKH